MECLTIAGQTCQRLLLMWERGLKEHIQCAQRGAAVRGLTSGDLNFLLYFTLGCIFSDKHQELWCFISIFDIVLQSSNDADDVSSGVQSAVHFLSILFCFCSVVSCCSCLRYSSWFVITQCPQIAKFPSCFEMKPPTFGTFGFFWWTIGNSYIMKVCVFHSAVFNITTDF